MFLKKKVFGNQRRTAENPSSRFYLYRTTCATLAYWRVWLISEAAGAVEAGSRKKYFPSIVCCFKRRSRCRGVAQMLCRAVVQSERRMTLVYIKTDRNRWVRDRVIVWLFFVYTSSNICLPQFVSWAQYNKRISTSGFNECYYKTTFQCTMSWSLL